MNMDKYRSEFIHVLKSVFIRVHLWLIIFNRFEDFRVIRVPNNSVSSVPSVVK